MGQGGQRSAAHGQLYRALRRQQLALLALDRSGFSPGCCSGTRRPSSSSKVEGE